MIGKAGLIGCAICLLVGVGIGIGFALARPDLLRRIERKLGRDSRQSWFYNQNVAFHRRIDACVSDGAVLFIGDSFIQGLCVTEVTKDGINYGIGGDTTEGVLGRLPFYASLMRARAVVFTVGDNDLHRGRTEADVAANYRKIVAQVPPSLPIFFCALTPYVDAPEHAEINRGIASLNQTLKELCASDSRCYLVTLDPALGDGRGGLRSEFADDDGVHLNGKGYRLWIEKLREALAALPTMKAQSKLSGV